MSKTRIIVAALMSLFIVVYLLVVPNMIRDQIGRDPYSEWMQPDESEYKGVITVWHIVEFKPYLGSITTWLKERAKKIEDADFGVYIDVLGMTTDEYAERVQNGERADVYSFPAGLFSSEILMPMTEHPNVDFVSASLYRSGVYNNELLALPYLYSGYGLMINMDILSRLGESIPKEGVDVSFIAEGANRFDHYTGKNKKNHVYGLVGKNTLAAMLNITCDLGEAERFSSGNAAMHICDLRAIGDMERKNSAGKGINMNYYPISGYTDLVQYIGIAADISDQKVPYVLSYISELFTERSQLSLTELGIFPAVVLSEAPTFEMEAAQRVYDGNKSPNVMNTFLFNAARHRVNDYAEAVLLGEVGAYESYIRLIESLRA